MRRLRRTQSDIATNVAGWSLLAVLVAAYAVFSTRWLDYFSWSIDEGMYVMRARMMAHGFGLYDEIWFNHPPLLVQAVFAAFARFGESVEVARMVALGFACAGLVGVVLVARELEGWRAGLAAGLLLTVTPLYFSLSRAIMSTLPALSMAALAIGLAMLAGRMRAQQGRSGEGEREHHGQRGGETGRGSAAAIALLIASGLSFGIGAAIKLIVAPLGLPILVALFAQPRAPRSDDDTGAGINLSTLAPFIRRLAIWALAALVPLIASLAPFGLATLLDQTVGSVVGARSAYGLDVVVNLQDLLEWLADGHLGFAALGAYGIARGLNRHAGWRVVGAWMAAALISIILQTPLWSHHFVMLVLPLAVGAGPGIAWAIGDVAVALRGLRRLAGDVGDVADGWAAFGSVALLTFLLGLPVAIKRDGQSTRSDSEDPWRAIEVLSSVTEPGDYVVTDDPMIAFRTGLLVPPNLCDPGTKRFASGSLTLADVADDIVTYRPRAVVTWNERFAKEGSRGLPRWLGDTGWQLVAAIDPGRERSIYTPADLALPWREIGAEWSGGLHMRAAEIDESESVPGGRLRVVLEWWSDAPTPRPLTVFTHLQDASGERIGQQDNPPGRGVRPTDHWLPDEVIVDVYNLDISSEAEPGEYSLRIGMYDAESGAGWPLVIAPKDAGTRVDGDAIVIESITVGPRE